MTPSDQTRLQQYLLEAAPPESGGTGLVGAGGWIYLHGDTNSFLDYYFGLKSWLRADRVKASAVMARRIESIAELGARYFKFIVPEKIAVYPEYTPDILRSVPAAGSRPATALANRFPGNMRYLARDFLKAKPYENLFFRGDSHPNWAGSYVMYNAIISGCANGQTIRSRAPFPMAGFRRMRMIRRLRKSSSRSRSIFRAPSSSGGA